MLSFIETDSEINYTLAGYVMKVAEMLIQQRPVQILNYLYQDENIPLIKKLCNKIYSKSMMKLAMLIINMKNDTINGSSIGLGSTLYSDNITEKRVALLKELLTEIVYPSIERHSALELHISASGIILEIIQHWNNNFNGEVILRKLFTEGEAFGELVEQLVGHVNSSLGLLSSIFIHLVEVAESYQEESFSSISKEKVVKD